MAQTFETKCTECEHIIAWSYERSVYEGKIECPECDTFIIVDEIVDEKSK